MSKPGMLIEADPLQLADVSDNLTACAAERLLVARSISGDADAFSQLHDRYAARVYRHIYFLVKDFSEAEDLTAQTFLNAWEAIGRYQDRGIPILSWLLRIAHNSGVNYLRSKRNHADLAGAVVVEHKVYANPEEAAERVWDCERVQHAVLKLGEQERQVLILRFVDEMDYTQVASMLGKNVGTVRVIQYRAIHHLRDILKESA